MGHLEPRGNPLAGFPSIKAVPRKLPVSLAAEQVSRLLVAAEDTTPSSACAIAHCSLFFMARGFGRPSAHRCAAARSTWRLSITVRGKGGHERAIPLNAQLAECCARVRACARSALPTAPFFRSRFGRPLSRGAIYERVRTWGQRSRVGIPLSPHRMRHTFATHLVRAGVGLVTIRDLLGHRQITSTQIYLHVTAEDLRHAAARHPIGQLLATVQHLLPSARLPFQRARAWNAGG